MLAELDRANPAADAAAAPQGRRIRMWLPPGDTLQVETGEFRLTVDGADVALPGRPAPAPRHVQTETRATRARRLAADALVLARDAALELPASPHGRMPDGVGPLARANGLGRQTLTRRIRLGLREENLQRRTEIALLRAEAGN